MRLGIDLDGVVADFTGGWVRRYNDEFRATIDPLQQMSWGGAADLTHFEDMSEFWHWVRDDGNPTIFRSLEAYVGAVEALERLAGRHDIVVITTKPGWAVHDTFAWIADKLLPTREVHITRRKWEIDVDVYLDDGPHVLEQLVSRRPHSLVCRYVRPWNSAMDGAIDVEDWAQFESIVASFEKMR